MFNGRLRRVIFAILFPATSIALSLMLTAMLPEQTDVLARGDARVLPAAARSDDQVEAIRLRRLDDRLLGRPFETRLAAGPPTTITLSIHPQTLIANSGTTAVVTATVVDTDGLPSVGVTLTGQIAPPTLGNVNFPNPTSAGGQSVGTWTAGTTIGTGVLSAGNGAVTGTTSITLTAGTPTSITVQVYPDTLIANSGMTATITPTVIDLFQNPVSGVSLSGNTTPSSLGVISGLGNTDANGRAVGVWTSGTSTGTGLVRVSGGSVTGTSAITVTAGAPATVTLQANPGSVAVGTSSLLTATVVDLFNNPVANGTSVAFATDRGNVVTPRSTTNGIATSSISATLAGTAHLTATSGTAQGTTTVTFTPGLPATITLQANPTSRTVGTSSALTATVVDQYNNLVANSTSVTFATDRGSVISPRPTTNGIATSSISATLAGTAHITATSGTAQGTTTVTFTPGLPATITLQANPTSPTVGNSSVLTATVVDQYNNLVANGTSVAFATDRGSVISPRPTTNGIATSSISATLVGTAHITATSGTAVGITSVTFTPGPPALLTLSPATSVISAGVRITYTAVATDSFGNSIGNVTAGTLFSITPASGAAFVGSVVTPTVTGSYIVTGTNGSAVDTSTITVMPAPFSRLSIESAANGLGTPIGAFTLTLYDTLTVYAVRYDRFSNVITGSFNANWFGTNLIAGRLAPTTGLSTTFTPAPIVSGTGVITASVGSITATTGPITVLAPKLIITKQDNQDPVPAGYPLGYTIIYTNVGTAPAQGIVITETYDPNVTFSGAFPAPDPGSNNMVWSLSAALAPGQSGTIALFTQVAGSLPISTVLTNTVQIAALKTASNSYTQTTQVAVTPTLKIAKVQVSPVGASVRVSDTIKYQIVYTNTGTAILHNVAITETYDNAVQFSDALPPPTAGTNNRRWNIGTLSAGQTGSIALFVVVKAPQVDGTPLINLVTIDSDETTPLSYQVQPIAIAAPMLSVSQLASPPMVPADAPLTYTLLITNSGSTYASNVVVTDAIPGNVTYLNCAPVGCSSSSGVVTWALGQVAGQTSFPLTLSLKVDNNLVDGTILTNTARIAALETVAAVSSLTTTVSSAPALALSASDGASTAAAGNVLIYTIAYSNTGNAPAHNLVLTDTIPSLSAVAFQGCSACVPIGSGVYSFTMAPSVLNAGSSGIVTLSVKLASILPAGLRAITNTAAIRTTTAGANPAGVIVQDVDSITTVPALALNVDFDTSTPYETKVVTYTLHFTNTSKMDTTGVVISATKSPGVSFISSPGWSLAGGYYQYSIGTFPAGASNVVTYRISLPAAFTTTMDPFLNVFQVSDNGPGGLPVATALTTTLLGVPDLVIDSVSFSPASVVAGRKFTATVTIRNRGMGAACNPVRLAEGFGCRGSYVDVFLDPATPPTSYSFTGYEHPTVFVSGLGPGVTATLQITNLVLSAIPTHTLFFKVDNFACPGSTCAPSSGQRGLIPESNEDNNLLKLTLSNFNIYLPVVRKNR